MKKFKIKKGDNVIVISGNLDSSDPPPQDIIKNDSIIK